MSSAGKLVVRVNVYPHRTEETLGWERQAFEAAGVTYRFVQPAGPEELRAAVREADVVITSGSVFDQAAFAAMTRCRMLLNCGVGLDKVDVAAATRHGVMVCNMPDICTDEVADHAMALLLACNRKIVRLANRVRGGVWDRLILDGMPRLRGTTVGLLGFGRIAQGVAARCQAFGMNVAAYDPYLPPAVAAERGVALLDLAELLPRCDFVSCHLPHTEATHHLIGLEQLRAMKPTAYFVNTSRGKVVDEAALVRALREGWIAGAGLDVLEQEPPGGDNPLLGMENVVVTPHAAGFSDDVVDAIPRLAFDEVMSVLRGGRPREIAWANRAALEVAR